MVQIVVKIPKSPESPAEWALVELQGNLETRRPVPLGGKVIGDLHFSLQGTPIFIVGHHILYGRVVELEKPFAVISKVNRSGVPKEAMETEDTPVDCQYQVEAMEIEDTPVDCQYYVIAFIKQKILFKTRPKPIIANVPLKV